MERRDTPQESQQQPPIPKALARQIPLLYGKCQVAPNEDDAQMESWRKNYHR